jgi:ABC-type molybdenum transport system ATPase subunit/photorepair protein PhrA
VLGHNGAGKTQLLKILAGSVWPDPSSGPGARRYRWQGRWQNHTLGVQDEIAYLGPERQDRYARYDWNFDVLSVLGTGLQRSDILQRPLTASQRAAVVRTLQSLGIAELAKRRFLELSVGERRLVLLARALLTLPQWLLLDESQSGLDQVNAARLQRWLNRRRAHPSWVLTTHRVEDLPESATHCLVLNRGRAVACGARHLSQVRAALERECRDANKPVSIHTIMRVPNGTKRRRLVLAVEAADLWIEGRQILTRVSLQLRAGELLLLTGANGAGKTSLLRALYGDFPFAAGSKVTRLGVSLGEPLQNFRELCGFVAPQLQTDYPRTTSVLDVVISGRTASYGLTAPANAQERLAALTALRDWRLLSWARRPLLELSYGQTRRVLFARAWAHHPAVLLLDEPLVGLDLARRTEIGQRIERCRAAGTGVILATHELDDWPQRATTWLHIADGVLESRPVRG